MATFPPPAAHAPDDRADVQGRRPDQAAQALPDEPVLVACLCAAWCGTCTAYRPLLADIARRHPALRFAWIDIEDDADRLGDDALDVENFPTVMLLRAGRVLFHGTLLPHASTLERLLQALQDQALAPADAAAVPPTMAAAVWQLGAVRPV